MSKTRALRRVLACLLAFTLFVGAFPATASAQKTTSSAKLYALEFTTGAAGADISDIQSVIISYKSNGKDCTYTENLNEKTSGSNVMTSTLYSLQTAEEGTDSAIMGSASATAWEQAYGSSFIPYETQMFFFRPYESIDSIKSIQIVVGNSGKWELQGLRLIEVTQDSVGTVAASEGSGHCIPAYSGTCLAEMSGSLSMQWSQTSVYTLQTKESKSQAYLVQESESYSTYNEDSDNYYLRIQIADEYMAGLETLDLANDTAQAMDMLTATIYYRDVYGDTRVANIPVISGMMNEFGKDMASKIKAIAQQGNTLMVSCRLPGFAELITNTNAGNNGIKLTLGYDKTIKANYITLSNGNRNTTTIEERAAAAKDSISVTDIALYRQSEVAVAVGETGGEMSFTVKGSSGGDAIPDYYYSYKKSSGLAIEYNSERSFTLQDNRETKKSVNMDREASVSNLYLVEIDTSDIENASNTGDLSIKFTYTTYGSVASTGTADNAVTQGTEVTSEAFNVKTKVREFYGYWPGTVNGSADDISEDYAYYKGMLSNGKLQFLVSLANVDTFKSVTLTLRNGKQWQSSNVKISRVTGLKHRTITLGSDSVLAGNTTIAVNHQINREVTSTLLSSSAQEVLVRSGDSKKVSFSDSQSAVESSDIPDPLDTTVDEMSYEDACQSLGFSATRVTYDVDVTVAGTSDSDATNGDSGSKNLFYFRLNFENGSSAYVLANQQLSSDGFRAGQTERFSIAMNQSYGELISVDIIPDDESSKSDIYDKLNIDNIKVTRNNDSAVNRVWEVSNVGWIGVDYQEEADTSKKETGRYEGEITQNYVVDSSSYSVKLLFAIATGEYGDDNRQFSGTVQATLNYTDSSNQAQTITFDLVNQMYNYINVTPNRTTSAISLCMPDSSCMFRKNSTDRFYLNLADVQSIESITLLVCDNNGSTWNIKGIGVSQVKSTGDLILNKMNEYIYTGETEELTTQASESEPACSISAVQGSQTEQTIMFKPNTINIDMTTSGSDSATSTITRKPSGTNDTLNVFVQPKLTDGLQLGNFAVKTDLVFSNAYGRLFQNGISNMANDGSCYYALGLTATNFTQLKQVKITANGPTIASAMYGDGVIIQHVRAGTLLGTYKVNNDNKNLTIPEYSTDITEINNQETQTVTLYFGDATTNQPLSESGKNVAVSIGFKSSLGNNDQTYHSPYVYLTDEQYQNLTKNMMVDIDFHIPYIKEITDIRIAGMNGVDAVLDSATVATYTNDASLDIEQPAANATADKWTTYEQSVKKAQEVRTLTGWYSFSMSAKLSNEAQVFTPTNTDTAESGALVPVKLTLTTQNSNVSNDGLDLEVTVSYLTDENGYAEMTKVIPSVKSWLAESNPFTVGGSFTLSFMLSDVSAITGVKLRAVGSGATYPLDTLNVEWNRYGTINTTTKVVGATIGSQETTVSLLNGSFEVSATSIPADGSAGLTLPQGNITDLNFALTQGDRLSVTAIYSSSLVSDFASYTLFRLEGTSARSVVSGAVSASGSIYNVNTSGLDAGDYELYIYSDKSKAQTSVKFTVKEKAKVVTDDTDSGSGAGSGADDSASESSSSGSGSNTSGGTEE